MLKSLELEEYLRMMEHLDESLLLYPRGDLCEARGDAGEDGGVKEQKRFHPPSDLSASTKEVFI